MIVELNGLLNEESEWFTLCIGDTNLTDYSDEFDGEIVKLTYYLSKEPINKETAVERFLSSFYEGLTEIDGQYCSGSEWTGVYAKNDTFEVGGHNIIKELTQHIGMYCYLILETKEQ